MPHLPHTSLFPGRRLQLTSDTRAEYVTLEFCVSQASPFLTVLSSASCAEFYTWGQTTRCAFSPIS